MTTEIDLNWKEACSVEDLIEDGGVCVLINDEQIALFKTLDGQFFATQNLCPHKKQMALSRGMIGSQAGEPKVACPFHKKTFSLETGRCLSGEDYQIKTYPIRIIGKIIFIGFD
jgi:nitrite reductase (NADH) small subunit